MKKILITGASGLVGSNLYDFLKMEYSVIGTHLNFPTNNTVYLDVNNHNGQSAHFINEFHPDIIIHCGALTNVEYCEINETESYLQNVVTTKKIIEIAKLNRSKIVYFSTDYVFDGVSGPYDELDSPNPINIYGKHKLICENLILEDPNNLVVRITNVYGNELRNKNFLSRIILQISKGEFINLKLPYDQFATPIGAHDIAKAINLLLKFDSNGIFHLSSTDYMNRVHFANLVLNYFDYGNYKLEVIDTKNLNQVAKRPLKGGLLNFKFCNKFPEFEFTNINYYLNKVKNDTEFNKKINR